MATTRRERKRWSEPIVGQRVVRVVIWAVVLSASELLSQLAGIQETVLIYPSTGGLPKARRMTTELTGGQPRLHEIFRLDRWAPKS